MDSLVQLVNLELKVNIQRDASSVKAGDIGKMSSLWKHYNLIMMPFLVQLVGDPVEGAELERLHVYLALGPF